MAFRIFPRFDKEGPGVYLEDIENRSPTTRFFQILGRKFWRLCLNNLTHVLCNIFTIVLAFIIVGYAFSMLGFSMDSFIQGYLAVPKPASVQELEPINETMPVTDTAENPGGQEEIPMPTDEETAASLYFMLNFIGAMFIVGMNLVSMGPVQTGLSYLYRNYSREIPTFTWSDFKESLLLNWKDSLKIMGINLLLTILLITNILFYRQGGWLTGLPATILSTIFFLSSLFFLCMNIFIYPMLASLELKVRHIYKNAALFAISRLIPVVGILLLNVLILLAIPLLLVYFLFQLGFLIVIVYYLCIAFALTHYINSFFTWQQIDRFIIKGGGKQEPVEEEIMEKSTRENSGITEPSLS